MLKISMPLNSKNEVNPTKQMSETVATPFNPLDLNKVTGLKDAPELFNQHGGMIDNNGKPTLLMNLLKDPSVTVSYLKNIAMLQEIIKLLPMNNKTVTEEIEQLFEKLLITSDGIMEEMVKQEKNSTSFKGELFDFLRNVVSESSDSSVKLTVANLLKALNCQSSRGDILGALGNGLDYLSDALSASNSLSSRLMQLADGFRDENAMKNFDILKNEVLELADNIENSILYNGKIAQHVSILKYNLSRFNDNPNFIREATRQMLLMLNGSDNKTEFLTLLNKYVENMKSNGNDSADNSEIMDVLAKILGKQCDNQEIRMLNSESLDKIIHSLLSSPCNFTPLLHYVIPVNYEDLKSFAEVWINPNGKEDAREANIQSTGDCTHMLIVFDIDGMGRFEAELFVQDKKISFSLMCPEQYVEKFESVKGDFQKCIAFSEYYFDEIRVDKMKETRSLLQIFKSLPYKRTGIDVKI